MPDQKEPIPQFAARIKAKYPQYKDMDDTILVNKIIEKYPQYRPMVDMPEVQPIKKKEPSGTGSVISSAAGEFVTPGGIKGWMPTDETVKQITKPQGGQSIVKQQPAASTTVRRTGVDHRIQQEAYEKKIANEIEYAKKAIEKGQTLEDMAALFMAQQDQNFGRQFQALRESGQFKDETFADILSNKPAEKYYLPADNLFGEATKGKFMQNALSNPQFLEALKERPDIYEQFKQEKSNFLTKYPEAGKVYLANILSDELAKSGKTNSVIEITTKKEFDEAVKSAKEKGRIDAVEEMFVNKEIRPTMGFKNWARSIIGKPAIKTTDLITSALTGAFQGSRDLGQGITEFTGIRPLIQGKKAALSSDIERENISVAVKAPTLWGEIMQEGGTLLGQSLATGGGAKALGAAGIKNAAVTLGLSGGLQAYGNYAPESRRMFPESETKQRGFATVMSLIEAGTEGIFRDDKVLKGLMGELSPTVKRTINDFTAKKITAAAAKEQVGNAFKQAVAKAPEAAKLFAKAVGENTLEEVAAQIGQDAAGGIFEGKPVEDLVNIENIGNTARQAFLGSGFIGALATRADLKKNQGISAKQIYLMARDPETWATQIRESSADPADANDIEDKLGNLEYAANLLKELDETTQLTEKQKTKYLLTSLDNKIKGEQQSTATDPILRAQAENQIRETMSENDKVKEGILKGEDDGSYEGDNSDKANKDEAKLFKEIYEKAPEGYKATLDAAKEDKLAGLEYMKDKYAENPIKFREEFGDETTDKVLAQTPTEKLQEKLDYLLDTNTDDPSIPILDKIIESRQPKQDEGEQLQQAIPEAMGEAIAADESLPPTEESQPNETATTESPTTETEVTEETGQPPISEPPPPPPKSGGIHAEQPPFTLIKSELGKVRARMGLGDYESDTVTDLEAMNKAQRTTAEWKEKGIYEKEINKVMDDANVGKVSDEGQNVLAQYIADLNVTAAGMDRYSPEYDNNMAKLKKATDAGDKMRSEFGRGLGRNRLKMRGETAESVQDVELDMMNDFEVDQLTPEQKKEAEKRFNDLDQALKKEQELRAKAEEEVVRLNEQLEIEKAKAEIKKSKKSGGKKSAEEYSSERKELFKSIGKKWKDAGKDTLSSDIPFRKQLAAIAPDVGKVIKSYIDQGIDTLEAIRAALSKDLSDEGVEVSEEEVRALIAGRYNEKKETRNELANKVRIIREEEKLLLKLEELESGKEPTDEKKKVERNQRLKDIRDKIEAFQKANKSGKYGDDARFERTVKQQIENNRKKVKDYEERIKKGDFSDNEPTVSVLQNRELQAKNKALYDDYLKSAVEKQNAMVEYEKKRLEDQIRNYGLLDKLGNWAGTALATSKGTVAMFDQSGVLVQMLTATLSHPLQTIKNFPSALRDLATAKYFKERMAKLKDSPLYKLMEDSDLALYDPDRIDDNFRNELMGGRKNLWSRDITIGGKKFSVGKAMERSTANLFNNMRVYLFQNGVEKLYTQGKTWDSHPEEFKALARAINEWTGHGKIQKNIAQAAPVVNTIIWSPKMMASTFNVLGLGDLIRPVETAKEIGKAMGIKGIKDDPTKTKGFYSSLTPTQRAFMRKELARMIGTVSVLVLANRLRAALSGSDDEEDLNPQSTGFGNIKVDKKDINLLGRYGGAIKAITQVATGNRIVAGKEDDLWDDKGFKGSWDVAWGSQGRGKMTPFAGVAHDLIFNKQKNYYTREKMTPLGTLKQLTVPMSFQEISKDFKNDGVLFGSLETLFKIYGGNIRDDRDYRKK